MNFENDPIADKVTTQLSSLSDIGLGLVPGKQYNRVFELLYELQKPTPSTPILGAEEVLDAMTDDQRFEIISKYCKSCGSKQVYCQCWNDV